MNSKYQGSGLLMEMEVEEERKIEWENFTVFLNQHGFYPTVTYDAKNARLQMQNFAIGIKSEITPGTAFEYKLRVIDNKNMIRNEYPIMGLGACIAVLGAFREAEKTFG